jgi:hypothetical protein
LFFVRTATGDFGENAANAANAASNNGLPGDGTVHFSCTNTTGLGGVVMRVNLPTG